MIYACGIAVAPDIRRENGLMPLVDIVQHGLAHQVVADGVDFQSILCERLMARTAVGSGVRPRCLAYAKVVPPAWKLNSVISKALRFFADDFEWQVGPLAGEQGNRTRHSRFHF